MTTRQIENRINKIKAIEAEVAELNEQIDALKEELKNELNTRNADSVETDSFRVFWNIYEKASVDTQKLKDAGLYDTYSKKSVITQFKITNRSNA